MYYMILSSKKMTSWKKLAELITVPYNIPLKYLKCVGSGLVWSGRLVVWSPGRLVSSSVPIDFPRRTVPMSSHVGVLVLTHVTVPMSSHVGVLVLTHAGVFFSVDSTVLHACIK